MTQMSTKPVRPDFQAQRLKLQEILQSISTFGPGLVKPPMIDSSMEQSGESSSQPAQQEPIPGLRSFRDTVKRDLEVLERFLDDAERPSLPSLSANAPYLISVWNEVLLAPPPITTIWPTFSETGDSNKQRKRGHPKDCVKIDVVADSGRRWIRVNSVKNSRMLAEFREIDSYDTDSEDDQERSSGDYGPSLAQTEFDNSLLCMGRSLLNAARLNPIPGSAEPPSITLRLTRLDPCPSDAREHDPRIAQTIKQLRDMGIDVQIGERDPSIISELIMPKPITPRRLQSTTKINLDLSILIALVSDLTHSSLPTTAEEADTRFTPSEHYVEWKKTRVGEAVDIESITRPCRALSHQALQEMHKGLLQEMFERLSSLTSPSHSESSTPILPADVEFWTTPEARDRCLKIISKIGGPNEKRRASALFPSIDIGLSEAEESYWKGSRYPPRFIPLLPIHLFKSSAPSPESVPPTSDDTGRLISPFFLALAQTCRGILEQEVIPDPRSLRLSPSPPLSSTSTAVQDGREDDEEIERATVTKANPRLTAHTVQSMLWGAVKGWTTLTANRSSVKAMLREMKSGKYCTRWDQSIDKDDKAGNTEEITEIAALWVVDPRSLAEGMRADFGPV
ncbi:hypothetical protein C8Q75DRAFT_747316 [Abortiporus biennis]|nr:hypothetical protein C8Q75DRAFT_747316 [Abortiporus biennis]